MEYLYKHQKTFVKDYARSASANDLLEVLSKCVIQKLVISLANSDSKRKLKILLSRVCRQLSHASDPVKAKAPTTVLKQWHCPNSSSVISFHFNNVLLFLGLREFIPRQWPQESKSSKHNAETMTLLHPTSKLFVCLFFEFNNALLVVGFRVSIPRQWCRRIMVQKLV